MHITPFAVEQWMNETETRCIHNLAETCVHSISLSELRELCGVNGGLLDGLESQPLTYGAIEGSERLRNAIAATYADHDPARVLTTHGTIGANDLVWRALAGPGDKVVSIVPTYQQHTAIPASLRAEVVELRLRAAETYLPDLDALKRLARGAKVISLVNPNNPTGALVPEEMLRGIVEIAVTEGAYVLCDEVYRGTGQSSDGLTASIVDLYDKGIATGGLSKAYALAGLRVGWIAGPQDVLAAAMQHRDYTTISVGVLDEYLAALALEARDALLTRARQITRANLDVLSNWVDQTPEVSWVRPTGGTVTLLSYQARKGSYDFCRALLEETGVLLTPGAAFGEERTLRIGFANKPQALRDGLPKLGSFLAALP
ncbi:MAG: aminotransferase class I/II-fold pyridoxal phosphate-dependent enzyme [Pseudomonadota bacterium]